MSVNVNSVELRVSLLGGGTDMPEWVELRGKVGGVLVTKIRPSLHCITEVTSTLDNFYDVTFDQRVDTPLTSAIYDLDDLGLLGPGKTLRVSMAEDLPTKGTGLGSSAAWIRANLNALHQLELCDQMTPQQAYNIERSIGSSCGYQDHVAAILHGTCAVKFTASQHGNGWEFDATPVVVNNNELHRHLHLVRVGGVRDSNAILARQVANMSDDSMSEMLDLMLQGVTAVYVADWEMLGKLVGESWEIKKRYAKGVTSEDVDAVVAQCLNAGAYGCKILGAGGCGFVLAVAEPDFGKTLWGSGMTSLRLDQEI